MLSLFNFDLGATLVIGALLATALLGARSAHRPANLWLIGIIALVTYFNSFLIFRLQGTLHQYPWLLPATQPIRLIAGPIMFFFIRSLTAGKPAPRKWEWLYFVPASVWLLDSLFFHAWEWPNAHRLDPNFSPGFRPYDFLIATFNLPFFLMAGIRLLQHQRQIERYFSNLDQVRLHWAFLFWLTFCVSWTINMLGIVAPDRTSLDATIIVLFSACIYGATFYALKQSIVLFDILEKEKPQYQSSRLEAEKLERLKADVQALFASEKLYLDPNLNLFQVAEKLNIDNHTLSQLLNLGFGKNFYRFINEYRVNEAKKLLKDPQAGTKILSVAYDCGFNSKSAFNAAFKQIVGKTPSAFRATDATLDV